jgi:hypothetical protein
VSPSYILCRTDHQSVGIPLVIFLMSGARNGDSHSATPVSVFPRLQDPPDSRDRLQGKRWTRARLATTSPAAKTILLVKRALRPWSSTTHLRLCTANALTHHPVHVQRRQIGTEPVKRAVSPWLSMAKLR